METSTVEKSTSSTTSTAVAAAASASYSAPCQIIQYTVGSIELGMKKLTLEGAKGVTFSNTYEVVYSPTQTSK